MAFEKQKWDKFSYKRRVGSKGLIGEIIFKENRRIVDSFKFSNNHEFNIAITIAKKRGFEINVDKKTREEQVRKETEQVRKELEEIRNNPNPDKINWLEKAEW